MSNHSVTKLVADYKVLPENFPADNLLYTQEYRAYSELHYHNCLEIGLCINGNGAEMIGNKLYSFKENNITVIPQNCIHDSHINSKIGDECSTWKFIFINPLKLGIDYDNFNGFLTDNHALIELFNIMYDELERKNKNYQSIVSAILSSFMMLSSRIASDGPLTSPVKLPVELTNIVQHIHSSYNEPITISELSKKYNISNSTLNRMFNTHFGVSPLTYINNVRLTIAENMLLNSNLSILSISTTVGFDSLSSFNRLFKKKYNISPRILRQNKK